MREATLSLRAAHSTGACGSRSRTARNPVHQGIAILLAALLSASGAAATQGQAPPEPAAPRKAAIPHPEERTLDNGLRVIAVQKHGVPLVAVRLLLKTGAESDPPDHAGLADMSASLLTKGTKSKTAEQMSREVEALGATIESGASWDYSAINLSALSSNFSEALAYVADAARNATFAAGEIARLATRTSTHCRWRFKSRDRSPPSSPCG